MAPAEDLGGVSPRLALLSERDGLATLGVVHALLVRPEVVVDGYPVTGRAIHHQLELYGSFSGAWAPPAAGDDEEELYDYNIDPWETNNFVANASYAAVVAELRAVLRKQYVGG